MTLSDLLERVISEVPEASVRGFVALCNRELRRLARERDWLHWTEETSFDTTHAFTNLTVSGTTITDGDGGGLFDALHKGQSFTIDGTGHTIAGVTSADIVELSIASTASSPASGTLARVVFALPDSTLPFRKMVKIFRFGEEEWNYLNDPVDYRVSLPVAGVSAVELRNILTGSTDYIVRYVRDVTDVVNLASTVDVDERLEDGLLYSLAGLLFRRTPPGDELAAMPWQRRVSEYERLRAECIQREKGAETRRRNTIRKNSGTVFQREFRI